MEKGEIVWIPCRISQGMFEYERQIRLEGMSISGFVNVAALENPDVEVGRVRGLVFEEDRESEKVRVFVPGEFVQSSNVMVVPHRVLSSLSSTQPGSAVLGYEDLRKAVEQGRLLFDPSIDPDMQIGLSSIDLRLGYGRGEIKKSTGETIQPADPAFEIGKYIIDTTLGPGQPLIIQPRQFLLATVYEEVSLPNDLGAYVWGKSTIARFGLSVHATAPLIHPTWVGHITLELYNNGTRPLMFTPGRDPICQLTFHEIETPIPAEVARSLGSFMKQTVPSGSQ